jgi:hydrogenase maturation protein HypF
MKKNRNQEEESSCARTIYIQGLVQGIGFRPFIFILAEKSGIKGWVENRNDGVLIHAEGLSSQIDDFIKAIQSEAPTAASITKIISSPAQKRDFQIFRIEKSQDQGNNITEISPDISVCDACLKDMQNQENRIAYPFINCTHCGPRFTIIRDLPYDRKHSTMDSFPMCPACKKEYEDVYDRRFHAQPIACNHCGPEYTLCTSDQKISGIGNILLYAASLLDNAGLLAIKGLGGYHLACNAFDNKAVERLRNIKKRDAKPFAIMFRDIKSLKPYAELNAEIIRILTSWQKPILILPAKKHKNPIVNAVSNGFPTLGVMLPYLPFHYLLFEKLNTNAIVLSSANFSEEPILINDTNALNAFLTQLDAVIINNREIHNRTDDSVLMTVNNTPRLIRRSRGYVPSPIHLQSETEGIFAAGAELVNCFCIGKGKQAIMSQHIGDLKNPETYEFYTESIGLFERLFRFEPTLLVSDMHPDYLSTQYCHEQALPILQVQHHHAHAASCMAENGLDEKVIAVCLDGTGSGPDGKIWGAEFLIADLDAYQRITHFEYIALPGGDAATKETWRMALSYLYKYFGDDLVSLDIPFIKNIDPHKRDVILHMIRNNINSIECSSAGRLFDAVAALTGICTQPAFHAEAPMRLEALCKKDVQDAYSFDYKDVISFRKCFYEIVEDIRRNTSKDLIAGKFHNTIIKAIFAAVSDMRKQSGISKLVLSGGTFQNRYLSERIETLLIQNDFDVFVQSRVPANDAGIALGQLAVAAKKRALGKI